MIALVATLLVAVYILGPDLFARWFLGFVVQRKNVVQTKSEEITKGILWATIPLFIAWISRHYGPFHVAPGSRFDAQTFFSGIYSESYFNGNRDKFFAAVAAFIRLNCCILFRLYFVVFIASLTFNWVIGRYGSWRHRLRSHPRVISALTKIVIPRISEWHVIFSPLLLPSKEMNIKVDVLTKSGILYEGFLIDKMIGADGSLQSLTLGNPRRFKREQYLEERKGTPTIEAHAYWKDIPGNLFVIIAADITTVNVRHIPATVREFREEFKDIAAALNQLASKVRTLQK